MPEIVDWHVRDKPRRLNPLFYVLFAVIILIFFGGSTVISYWVDLLWFSSLGYASVFWKSWSLELGTFAVFAVLTFGILIAAFFALRHHHAGDLPETHTIYVGPRAITLPVVKAMRIVAVIAALVVSLITGVAMQSQWPTLALYWNAPHSAQSIADPIFGLPLGFYLFTLPAWQLIAGWLLMLAIFIAILAAVFFIAAGSGRALDGRFAGSLPWRGVSVAAGLLLFTLAIREYIGRFTLLFEHHTIFDGITYVDAHVTIFGMACISIALVVGALIAIVGGATRPSARWLLAAAAPAVLCYVIFGIAGWYVTTFVVKPNQLDRERPYIADNIASTRQAYGLDTFTQREFPADTTIAAADPEHNQATLQNIRLWDVNALQDTLRQVQEIRTYYDFPGIDIDRYKINGSLREVMLGVRELNVDKLPESSRNWINDKLIYTHGYGITMNPVNGFTPEGLPTLYLSNMPVQSSVPDLKVTRPGIYFGELTDTDVYVKTHQQEFNYPEGATNNLSNYDGTGGIELGGFLRRVLLAFNRGDVTKIPFSDDVTTTSRLLMRRNIMARVSALAPFLTFDGDPYIVVGDDGRLSWIIDAYTSSASYPYSTQSSLANQPVNYIRNSVKAVVDAYDGTVTFYVFDKTDPILAAWRGIFPDLFKDVSAMPTWLRAHVRYPEMLVSLQAELYGLYHMTDPEVFYNREDQWTVATENSSQQDGNQATPMSPNFVLMTLPGESNLEFVEILPFTPISRNNMIGWIAARSDGDHYGTAMVFDFPKTRLVDGPQQIEARIDQNAQLSGQLTLWNQQGSHVIRGSLLVIPCGQAILYAEPIYLQAQRSPMPELRLVVLALQDRLAYGPTFDAALSSLFGSEAASIVQSEPSQPGGPSASGTPTSPSNAAQPTADTKALIARASSDFTDYQRLTSEGKLSEAGQKLDDLKHTLDELNARGK
ncbi:MAG: UPF0182 family protein [Terracidiphilus sp.]|jgi:uncharacterized membrane protein (UPF0182 family)